MDTPTDLSGRPGGSDPDDETARALRAALGAPDDGDDRGAPRPRTVPSARMRAIERRAGRLHLRRQALALGGAAAAAAVVVAVGGLVLPQLQSIGGANSASGGSADSGAAAGSAAEGLQAPSVDQGTPTSLSDAQGGETESRSGSAASAAALLPLGATSMLTAADVTAFDVPVQSEEPYDGTAQGLTLGACADGDAGSVQPTSLWRVDLNADARVTSPPPGLSERVAQLGSPEAAAAALTAVLDALPGCTGPGDEGRGPTAQLDATAVTPVGGSAVVTSFTTGQGLQGLQVLMASGATLVQLQVSSDAASAEAALGDLLPTARTALDRATGGTSTLPASGSP